MGAIVLRSDVVQGSVADVMGCLVVKIAGVPTVVTAELLASISYTVYQHNVDGTVTALGAQTAVSLDPSDVVLDTPVTSAVDPSWPARYPTGYNFQHELPPAAFPLGAMLYEVQYAFTLAAGGTIYPPALMLRTIPNRSA